MHVLIPRASSAPLCIAIFLGCSSSDDNPATAQGGSGGGQSSTGGIIQGGMNTTGGSSTGGTTNTGGPPATTGGTSTGGTTGSGGKASSGGSAVTGGAPVTGGSSNGGAGPGGVPSTGGAAGASSEGGASAGSGASGAGTSGASGAAGASGGSGGSGGGGGAASGVMKSEGCGKAPTLKSSAGTSNFSYNTLMSGSANRRYILRLPEDYDNTHPHRLILGFHGATNNAGNVAGNPPYFGLFALAEGSTIFIAPEAVDGIWSATTDVTYVDDILKQVLADVCVDTSRIVLEGFSQGAAMARTLACARPGVFAAAVGHSAGGLAVPSSCEPIPYLGSLGLQENGGAQTAQTDFFAKANGCTVETLPKAPTGGHVCTNYDGCSPGHPVRWCSYDGGHTPSPSDSGKSSSWMPQEVWTFITQF